MRIKFLLLLISLSCSFLNNCKKPNGLLNAGNYCFMNAALQCLHNSELLTNTLTMLPDDYYTNNGSLAHLYQDFITDFIKEEDQSYDPTLLALATWQSMRDINKNNREAFNDYSQQDPSEFISLLISEFTDGALAEKYKAGVTFYANTKQPNTLISQLFYSLQTSSLMPISMCSIISKSTEPINMNLLAVHEKSESLEDNFMQEFMPEKFIKNYKLGNDRYTDTIKSLCYEETAPIFIIGLKRLVLDLPQSLQQNRRINKKIIKPLSFPLNGFDLTLLLNTKKAKQYILKSFIIHSGNANGGHYTSYVKKEKIWYYCDDEFIKPISEEQMATIAQRGYAIDPTFLKGFNIIEDLEVSKEQTPVMFFYEEIKGS